LICFKGFILFFILIPLQAQTEKNSKIFVGVKTNADCFLKVDGNLVARLISGKEKKISFISGNHVIRAISLDGEDQWEKEIKIRNSDQKIEINIKQKMLERLSKKDLLILEEMVFVYGGEFLMGNNRGGKDEKPTHRVYISDFYISQHEITQQHFKAFISDSKYKTTAEIRGRTNMWNGEVLAVVSDHNFRNVSSGDNKPVSSVSWFDAIKYCNWRSEKENVAPVYKINPDSTVSLNINSIGYRLPTEAEWEFAARGGNKSKKFKYSGSNNIDDVGWVQSNSGFMVQDVGIKKPNEIDIKDMSGNVMEWCSDYYNDAYYLVSPYKNPIRTDFFKKSIKLRAIRGGAAIYPSVLSQVSNRSGASESYNSDMIGFRVVRRIKSFSYNGRNFIQ